MSQAADHLCACSGPSHVDRRMVLGAGLGTAALLAGASAKATAFYGMKA